MISLRLLVDDFSICILSDLKFKNKDEFDILLNSVSRQTKKKSEIIFREMSLDFEYKSQTEIQSTVNILLSSFIHR